MQIIANSKLNVSNRNQWLTFVVEVLEYDRSLIVSKSKKDDTLNDGTCASCLLTVDR